MNRETPASTRDVVTLASLASRYQMISGSARRVFGPEPLALGERLDDPWKEDAEGSGSRDDRRAARGHTQ